MAIDGVNEIINIVYIAKKLFDMGKYELVTESFFDSLEYDVYYENMYSLMENLFEHHYCRYYENKSLELHVLTDPVIMDFYTLAGEYSRHNNIPDDNNPCIQEAESQARRHLNFSYCLDWMLMGHTQPERPYHSRLGLLICQDDYVDLGCLAYGLIELYEWFANQCVKLRNVLRDGTADDSFNLRKEAMAA